VRRLARVALHASLTILAQLASALLITRDTQDHPIRNPPQAGASPCPHPGKRHRSARSTPSGAISRPPKG